MPARLTSQAPTPLAWIWLRTSGRHWRGNLRQTLALIAVLGLGVAAFLAVRMANRAAVTGFAGFSEAVTSRSDLVVERPGSVLGTAELLELRAAVGTAPAELVPLVEGRGTLAGRPDLTVRLTGVDLVGLQNVDSLASTRRLLPPAGQGGGDGAFWQLLQQPRGVWLAPDLMKSAGASPGKTLTFRFDGRDQPLVVHGPLPPTTRGVDVPPDLAVMDLPAAQQILGRPGEIDRVELVAEPGAATGSNNQTAARAALVAKLAATLDAAGRGRWLVRTNEARVDSGARMTAAFRLNLLVLSLIALLVGIYLIALGMDSAVVRRRREIGVLRSLGLTPADIRRLWTLDVLALALAGTAAGLVMSAVAAQFVVRAVARTVNSLYMETTATSAALTWHDVLLGCLLGLGGGAVAGWLPLRDAAGTPPAQVLASGRFRPNLRLFRRSWPGWLAIAAGCALAQLPPVEFHGGRFPLAGYATAVCWVLGGTVVAVRLVAPLARAGARLLEPFPAAQLGWRRLRQPTSRHLLAAAGLFVASGMAFSMGIMVFSFETTVVRWLHTQFQAELYLGTREGEGGSRRVPPAAIEWVQQQPGVRAVLPSARFNLELDGRPLVLGGSDFAASAAHEQPLWLTPPLPLAAMPAGCDAWAVVNETFTWHFDRRAGDQLTLPTPAGPKSLWLRAVKADYGNDRGLLELDLAQLRQWFEVPGYLNAKIHLDVPPGPLIPAWQARWPGLIVISQQELLATALRIFRDTFAVTGAIEVIGLGVALAGLALAVLNLIREDGASLRTLAELGLTRRQIARVVAAESAGLALIAALAGAALSLAFGWLLVYVVNRQSFGWTLVYQVPWRSITLHLLAITAFGALTGWTCGFWRNQQETEA